jgi:hypothetical protein
MKKGNKPDVMALSGSLPGSPSTGKEPQSRVISCLATRPESQIISQAGNSFHAVS